MYVSSPTSSHTLSILALSISSVSHTHTLSILSLLSPRGRAVVSEVLEHADEHVGPYQDTYMNMSSLSSSHTLSIFFLSHAISIHPLSQTHTTSRSSHLVVGDAVVSGVLEHADVCSTQDPTNHPF